MRVKIKKIPNAAYGGQQSNGALDVTPSAYGGASSMNRGTDKVKKTLSAVPRKEANLEAEGGETAFGPISGDTIPDHMVIKGARHSSGGVPLNLPEDTFIFSDTKSMKIKDPKILKMFGKTRKKGGYTPADLAKPYDINKYKAILMDPDSDRKDRDNAELMIKNYIMKLGALAIAQESKKGFPQGIPEMARPYMEANQISEEDLMPKEEQEGQPEMPEGEMAEGGTPEYPHGGFHTPFEKSMEKAKEIDFTALSAPKLEGPQGQYTEDETLGNIYGAEPGVRMNTEGELYENKKKQEQTPGQDISFEVGLKNAYDADMNMLADQGAYMAGAIGNVAEEVKTAKRMKSIFDKSMDQDTRENTFSGLHYANTPGVVAPSGVSPTSVQSYRSQYGGELDRFVYGGDEPINSAGTRDFTTHFNNASQPVLREQPTYNPATDPNMTKNYMTDRKGNITGQAYVQAGQNYNSRKLNRQFKRGKVQGESFYDSEYAYGGTPMAMYGMEMGGSYYPTMSTGGTRRVKITGLPKAHSGANVEGTHPQHHDPTYEEAREETQEAYDAATEADGWRIVKDAQGRTYKVLYKAGKEVAGTRREVEGFQGEVNDSNRGSYGMSDVCSWLTDENSKWYNASYASLTGGTNPVIADTVANKKMYDECAPKQEKGEEEVKKAIKVVDTPDPKQCQCKLLDSEGNWTGKYEQYEGTVNEETGELECPDCEYEEEITTDSPEYEEPARWSDRAIGNLITQTRFRTDAERLDPTLIDRPEYSPVLQRRYDQDIQSNLSGLRKSIDTGGGTTQQKLFQNLAALDSATTQVGKRQKQTEDYNVNVLNQAAQIAANLQSGTDSKNQAYMDRTRGVNLAQADKETSAKNAKLQAINMAKTDAQNEMLQKATWNFNNPEFQIDYKSGMPFYNPNYKDANATRGQSDLTAEYMSILGNLGDSKDGKNKEIAFNLAKQKIYGNTKKQFGGYISANSMFPFFNE